MYSYIVCMYICIQMHVYILMHKVDLRQRYLYDTDLDNNIPVSYFRENSRTHKNAIALMPPATHCSTLQQTATYCNIPANRVHTAGTRASKLLAAFCHRRLSICIGLCWHVFLCSVARAILARNTDAHREKRQQETSRHLRTSYQGLSLSPFLPPSRSFSRPLSCARAHTLLQVLPAPHQHIPHSTLSPSFSQCTVCTHARISFMSVCTYERMYGYIWVLWGGFD